MWRDFRNFFCFMFGVSIAFVFLMGHARADESKPVSVVVVPAASPVAPVVQSHPVLPPRIVACVSRGACSVVQVQR